MKINKSAKRTDDVYEPSGSLPALDDAGRRDSSKRDVLPRGLVDIHGSDRDYPPSSVLDLLERIHEHLDSSGIGLVRQDDETWALGAFDPVRQLGLDAGLGPRGTNSPIFRAVRVVSIGCNGR